NKLRQSEDAKSLMTLEEYEELKNKLFDTFAQASTTTPAVIDFHSSLYVFTVIVENECALKKPHLDDEVVVQRTASLTHIYAKNVSNGAATIYAGKDVPVGLDDFSKMVNWGFSLVDKTLLVKDLIDSNMLVSLVVQLRHFGKTTNLIMLKNFFAVLITPSSKEHQLELFKEHFCKYPVIFISLKPYLSGMNNIVVYSMFDDLFSDRFGFTEREVNVLLEHHQRGMDMEEVKKWHTGLRQDPPPLQSKS
ncbi:9448_t:CDS:2, partial [Paraglomus brasilianum]